MMVRGGCVRIALAAIAILGVGSVPRPSVAQPDGGCSATVYWDANFAGQEWTLHGSIAFVGPHWNDQISSIVVHRGLWVFFWDANYSGETMRLGPGTYAFVGNHWNDQISSARCIQPTG